MDALDQNVLTCFLRFSPKSDAENQEHKEKTWHLALNNLSLSIEAGQKVAVCGRTGR